MTSDERRRVAEGLRVLASSDDTRYAEPFCEQLTDIVDFPFDGTNKLPNVADNLADLIDPTCEMKPQGEGFRCSACGRYHDMSGFEEFPWPRCPECGARVVRGDD